MPPTRSFTNKNKGSSIWGDSQFSDQLMVHSGLDDLYDEKGGFGDEDDNSCSVGCYGDDQDLEDDDQIVRQVLLRSNSTEPLKNTGTEFTETIDYNQGL